MNFAIKSIQTFEKENRVDFLFEVWETSPMTPKFGGI